MQFVEIETMAVVDRQQIADRFPNTSLPMEMDDALLSELGFAVLDYDPDPVISPGETVTPGPVRTEGGRYVQSWTVNPAPTRKN